MAATAEALDRWGARLTGWALSGLARQVQVPQTPAPTQLAPPLEARGRKGRWRVQQSEDTLNRVIGLAAEDWASTIAYLRRIDPLVFEELVLSALARRGYAILRNERYSGDGGIDGRVWINGQCRLIQGSVWCAFLQKPRCRQSPLGLEDDRSGPGRAIGKVQDRLRHGSHRLFGVGRFVGAGAYIVPGKEEVLVLGGLRHNAPAKVRNRRCGLVEGFLVHEFSAIQEQHRRTEHIDIDDQIAHGNRRRRVDIDLEFVDDIIERKGLDFQIACGQLFLHHFEPFIDVVLGFFEKFSDSLQIPGGIGIVVQGGRPDRAHQRFEREQADDRRLRGPVRLGPGRSSLDQADCGIRVDRQQELLSVDLRVREMAYGIRIFNHFEAR